MIPEYAQGQTATLVATFAHHDVPTDPTNAQVTIYYKDEVKVAAADAVKVSTGHYYKEISIPEDWDTDYYAAVWTGIIGGISFKKSELFRVIESATLEDITIPSGSYSTVADVLRELAGIDYSLVDDYINILAAEIVINDVKISNRTGRTFKRVTTASYLNGSGRPTLLLPYVPIYEIGSLQVRVTPNVNWWTPSNIVYVNTVDHRGISVRDSSLDSDVKSGDLFVDCVNGLLTIPERILYAEQQAFPFWNYTFIEGTNNIMVSWTYGYNAATRPDDIRDLSIKMTALHFLEIYGDLLSGGATGVSADGQARAYPGIPFAGRLERLDREIDRILTNYRAIGIN